MTLLERARRLESSDIKTNDDVHQKDLAFLKTQVKDSISIDELAQLMAKHPERARSEIRTVSRRAFKDDYWKWYGAKEQESLVDDLVDAMFGFGPLEQMLDDPSITEIMVNGSESLFFEREGKLVRAKNRFADDEEVMTLIDRILGPLGRHVDESSPMVNARLSQGYRVNAIIPPLALDGPTLTIRKFTEHVMLLEEMIELGSLDVATKQFLEWAVRLRKNIAVSGGTGSGKTTLLNALSCVISPDERIITIEDSAELRFFEHPHVVRLEARPKNAEGLGEVTIRDLVANSLRMRPDRIVVGECRGAEALDMLQAMNTGHDGSLTTLHANSPFEVVMRLTTMVRYAADLPVDVIEAYIASAIDMVIQTARSPKGNRFISDIALFTYDQRNRICEVRNLFHREPLDDTGFWLGLPDWIEDVIDFGLADSEEVERWKQSLSFK